MAKRIVSRIGLASDIPTLIVGEIGYDTDKKVSRIGDGTPNAPRIITDKSTGSFDYATIDFVKYPKIEMYPNGTVDGVDISALNAANGFVARIADNSWAHRSFTNTDGNLTITNGDGIGGPPTFNLSAAFLATIPPGGALTQVDSDSSLFGLGTAGTPLGVVQATETQLGGAQISNTAEVDAGVDNTTMITPLRLASISDNSTMALALRNVVGLVYNTTVPTPDFVQAGTAANPLELAYKAIIPMTTAQRNSLPAGWPTLGQTVYNTDAGRLETWNGTNWLPVRPDSTSGNKVYSIAHAADLNQPTGAEITDAIDGDTALVHNVATDQYVSYTRQGGAWVLTVTAPTGLPYATTTTPGIVEIATQAETDTGTDSVRMVSPAVLRNLTANSLTSQGIANSMGIGNGRKTYSVANAGNTNAPTALQVPNPSNGDTAIVHDTTNDVHEVWTRQAGVWVSTPPGGGGGAGGFALYYEQILPGVNVPLTEGTLGTFNVTLGDPFVLFLEMLFDPRFINYDVTIAFSGPLSLQLRIDYATYGTTPPALEIRRYRAATATGTVTATLTRNDSFGNEYKSGYIRLAAH